MTQFLISVGCNKEATDNDGRTPLHAAWWNGLVKFLISVGCNKEAATNDGNQ